MTEYYQKILLEQFQSSSQRNDWESFIEEIFDYLSVRTSGQTFAGCPYAVMGMETALSKPAVLSRRMLSIYQGYLLLGRINGDLSYLKNAEKNMIEMYREYRSYHGI